MDFTSTAAGSQSESKVERHDSKYSLDQLLETVMNYDAHFGQSVPLDLLAKAARAFRSTELMTSLNDHIQSNQAIADWEEFSSRFFAKY